MTTTTTDTPTLDPQTAEQLADLTPREREITQLLAEGYTVKAIAERLGLAAKTIDTHKSNLMRKLDVHNRVELVRFALRSQLTRL